MGRPKSVILSPAETKAEIKANNAQAKELQAAVKANEKIRNDAVKEYDRVVKAATRRLAPCPNASGCLHSRC
jgi:hypothetical protein